MNASDIAGAAPGGSKAGLSSRRRSLYPRPETRVASGLHVVALLVALPVIGALAAVLTWAMGGTIWQIVGAALASWLVVQGIYVLQLIRLYLALQDERPAEHAMRQDDPAR